MASSFLKKKAEEQAKKIDAQYGQNAYGGSKWREEQKNKDSGGSNAAGAKANDTAKQNTKQNTKQNNTRQNTTPTTTSQNTTKKSSSFLQKKASAQAKKIDEKYGSGQYGGSDWLKTGKVTATDTKKDNFRKKLLQ